MKLFHLKVLLASVICLIAFGFHPGLSYVPEDLDFVPMGEEGKASAPKAPKISSGKTYVIPSINYKMVYIPPGTFMMGSPQNEQGRGGDETQHQVTLTKGFYMGVTEVTQGQWQKVMGSNPSRFKDCGENCPVDSVSWNKVQEFIGKLNQQEGGKTYRLPTEAEWEYACRAGSATALANGDIRETRFGPDPNLGEMGWYLGNSDARTHQVGRKKPNGWGLFDMHGNVNEWCYDWYGKYPSGEVTNPEGQSSGSDRVIRGGSWHDTAGVCRSAVRYGYTPVNWSDDLGFRLVRTID
jgi:formylglycine-generating enzyme required for sulfatase activity